MLILAASADAQSRVAVEVRSGVDVATQDLGDADLDTGFGFDGLVSYRFMPHFHVFGGWGWHRFTADESFAGSDVDFEETGYSFGVEFLHPLAETNLKIYLRGGGVYNHIEVENSDGDITYDTGHGLGLQGEAGLAISMGNHWMLKPGVRYRSLSREFEINNTIYDTELTYLSFALGISRSF